MGFRVERPGSNWIRIISEDPIKLPWHLEQLPGLKIFEPKEQGFSWALDVSLTTWILGDVRKLLETQYGVVQPWQSRVCASGGWQDVSWMDWFKTARTLYEHQQRAVIRFAQWAGTNGVPGGILADAVGLGKTATAIRWAALVGRHYARRPIVILGPKYLAETWRRELEADGHTDFLQLKGTTPRLLDPVPQWIFIHYEIVHAWWSQIQITRPAVVLLDEAHLVRNRRTRRAKGAAMAFASAPHKLALTGTPLMNRLSELHGLLELLTGSWTWGTPGSFRMRYAGAHMGEYGLIDTEASHVEELRQRLEPFYLRRTEDDLGVELPETSRSVIALDKDEDGRDEFEGYSAKQVADAILHHRGSSRTFEWLMRLRKRSARRKISTTVEVVKSYLAQGVSCVVFCWQRETCEEIARRLDSSASYVVHGGIPQSFRDARVSTFQNWNTADGAIALVATYDSLGTGVTLNQARVAVLHDLDFVPATMLQGEGRVTGGLRRKASTRSVWIVDPSGIDPIVLRLLRLKGTLIDEVAADGKAAEIAELLSREL